MKNSKLPAILGGEPEFKKKFPLTNPSLVNWRKISAKVKKIIETGYLTKGQHLENFEKKIAKYLGVNYAVAVSSCTLGLVLTLKALELEGEVILPSFTFISTGHAVLWNNLKPVFADVDPDNFNLDPDKVEKLITPKTSAIIGVHIFGNPCDVEKLEKIAHKYKLKLIFDSAHGFGALYKGKPLGRFGDAEVFSTSPTKLLVTGEGGVITTNNSLLAKKLKIMREYGNPGNYDSVFEGLNARMQEFSAILGEVNLKILEKVARKRNFLADLFIKRLKNLPGVSFQKIEKGNRSSYKDFSIVIDDKKAPISRDLLSKALSFENIDTRNYYDPPLHLQTIFKKFTPLKNLPVTEKLAKSSISLPMSSKMKESDVEKICHAIQRIFDYSHLIVN